MPALTVVHPLIVQSNETSRDIMKKYGLTAALTIVLAIVLIGSLSAAQVVDRIVAVVNGEIITFQDLLRRINLVVGQTPDPATAERIAPQVLDDMVNDIVLRQEAERLKVEVSDSEVENEIRQFKARRQLTEDDFARGLRLQGMTPEQFKERSRQDIIKNKMLGIMVRRKVVVTQEEINAYLERNRADLATDRVVRLQLVVLPDEERASALWNELDSGAISFDEAVEKHSIGPKVENGVLADVNWKTLDEAWREALRDLSVGSVSKPFTIQDRWVLLKLLDRKDAERTDQAALEEEAREAILRPKLEERFKEYMSGLRGKAVIENRL
jgi:peptidyl-prolyl cis-trans isomerase SurA